jgi:hypothetical protein
MRHFFFLIIFLVAMPVSAAELEDSIPVDLARALFDIPFTGQMRFYTDIPEGFPPFTVPANFTILGGMVMPNYLRVGIKGSVSMREGMSTFSTSLERDGYLIFPEFLKSERGFVLGETHPLPLTACHDSKGKIRVRAISRDQDVFFSLTGGAAALNEPGTTCAELILDRQKFVDDQLFRESQGIRRDLPKLSIPIEKDLSLRGYQPGMRYSGSNTGYETTSQIPSSLSTSELYTHFSNQLVSQQWSQDQGINSEGFVHGEWVKTIEDDQLIFGLLKVEKDVSGMFNLFFSISTSSDLTIQDDRMPTFVK